VLRVDPLRNPEPLIRRVYGYVAYRIGDGPDAEDITSETFERALRYQKSFDPQKGAISRTSPCAGLPFRERFPAWSRGIAI